MPESIQFRFGSCVVSPHKREVYLNGELRPISPKTFDTLLYLITHRDKVVTREELLSEIWKGRIVVDNVVSRTIMLARGAIGDSGEDPEYIATIQRIGYRFIGHLDDMSVQPEGDPAPPSPGLRLAFLPIQNYTGIDHLGWLELGLVSLVLQSLNNDARLTILPLGGILSCIESLPSNLDEGSRTQRVKQILNADVVVSAAVRKTEKALSLEFRLVGHDDAALEKIEGEELTDLGLRLAERLESRLFEQTVRPTYSSNNRFINECFARASQAALEMKWSLAARLYDLSIQTESPPAWLRLEHANVLSRLGDPAAIPIASAVLLEAESKEDIRLQAKANFVLAGAVTESLYNYDIALDYIEEAMRLVNLLPPSNLRTHVILRRAKLFLDHKKFDACKEALVEAEQKSDQRSYNEVQRISFLALWGLLAGHRGDWEESGRYFRQAFELARVHRQQLYEFHVARFLARIEYALGRFDESELFTNIYLARSPAGKDLPENELHQSLTLLEPYCELRKSDQIAVIKRRLIETVMNGGKRLSGAAQVVIDGIELQARGEIWLACDRLLEAASELLHFSRQEFYYYVAGFLLLNLVRAGRLDEIPPIRQAIDEFNALHNDATMRLAIDHCDAILHRLQGNEQGARAILAKTIHSNARSVRRVAVQLDLAWIHLENGELTSALQLTADLKPWLEAHPAGLLVGGRIACGQGDLETATRMQQAHLTLAGGVDRSHFGLLLAEYQAGGINGARLGGALPSTYFAGYSRTRSR